MIHAVSTLITTINDPDEISIGNIFRYLGTIVNPRFKAGKAKFGSGFTIGSIIRWSQAVANRFVDFGGTLMLNTKLETVMVLLHLIWDLTHWSCLNVNGISA